MIVYAVLIPNLPLVSRDSLRFESYGCLKLQGYFSNLSRSRSDLESGPEWLLISFRAV